MTPTPTPGEAAELDEAPAAAELDEHQADDVARPAHLRPAGELDVDEADHELVDAVVGRMVGQPAELGPATREFTQDELDAAAAQLFLGLDLARARVMARLAQAMTALDAALVESGRDPVLRRDVELLITDARRHALDALRRAIPGPGPAPAGVRVLVELDEAAGQ